MAQAREVCEGKCAMGRPCPTGLCRQSSKRWDRDDWYTGEQCENNRSFVASHHDCQYTSPMLNAPTRNLRRKSSSVSTGSLSSGRASPQAPRMLPSAPPSPSPSRSPSIASSMMMNSGGGGGRPYVGAAGYHSYTGSAPPSR